MTIELRHHLVETSLTASSAVFSTIAIENPKFFRSFVKELKTQIEDDEGPFFLSVEGKPSSLRKSALLFTDPFTLGNDEKKEDASFQKDVSSLLDDEGKSSFEELKKQISDYLNSLALYSTLPYEYEPDFSLSSFLKFVSFRPVRGNEENLESLVSSVLTAATILRKKLVVMCHLHGYLTPSELGDFHSELAMYDIGLLIVESSRPSGKLPKEKLVLVDSDLCEY